MSSTAARIIKNTGWLYAKMAITMFISLYTTRLILLGLGVSDFGIFNIVGGAISMLGFLNSAMASSTQRFMNYAEGEGNPEKKIVIFNISYLLHLLLSIVVVVILVAAGFIFFNGVLNIPDDRIYAAYVVYGSLIISTFFTVMAVPYDAVLNSHENMRFYSIVGILESLGKLLIAFICVYSNSDKLIVFGILSACVPIITRFVMRIYCHRNYQECIINIRKYYSKHQMKEMTGFAGWNFLNITSNMLASYGGGIVMNHFFGTLLNAAQGIASQINGYLMVFSNNMIKAVNPVISKSEGAGERNLMLIRATTTCKFSFAMLAFFAIPFLINTSTILNIWLREVPEWAVVFSKMLLVKALIEQLTIGYGTAINAEGNIKQYSKIISILNFLPIVLITLVFSFHGNPIWYYIFFIMQAILCGVTTVYYTYKNCNLELIIFFKQLLFPLLICFLTAYYLSVILINTSVIDNKIIVSLLSTFIYCLLFWYISLDVNERKVISMFIVKRK